MKRVISFVKNMFVLFLAAFLLFACEKNDPMPDNPNALRMLVLNEGNYGGSGNSSITGISKSDSTYANLFRNANNNRPLGDGAQSATVIGKKLYVCVNNSAKIEVMEAETFKSLSTLLLNESNPMYMVALNDSLAAVSNLYAAKLHIINTTTDRLSRTIDLPNPGEQMTVVGNNLVVATVSPWVDMTSPRTESLTVIDKNTLTIKSTTEIDPSLLFNYGKLCVDGGGRIWKITSNKAVAFDPVTQKIVETITLPASAAPSWTTRYDISPDRRFIYYVDGVKTVHRLSLDDKTVIKAFELTSVTSFYNLVCSPQGFVVTDVVDYTSSGWIFEYKYDGTLLNKFKAGINPQFVLCFK